MDDSKSTEQSEEEWWDDFQDFRIDAHHLMDASGREKTIWLPMLFALYVIHLLDGSVEIFFGAMVSGLVISAAFLVQFEWYRMFFLIQSEPDLEELEKLVNDNSRDGSMRKTLAIIAEMEARDEEAIDSGNEGSYGARLIREGGE